MEMRREEMSEYLDCRGGRIVVKRVELGEDTINISFSTFGEVSKAFRDDRFVYEFSKSLEEVSRAIAVVPFLCNVLPIAWIYDACIELEEVDADFFYAVNEIKRGYENLYPQYPFAGDITADRLVKSVRSSNGIPGSLALFSGGLDAFSTLVSKINESPILLTVWGSDVPLRRQDAWIIVRDHTALTAQEFGLDHCFVKSNFREFLNQDVLDVKLHTWDRDGEWWHDIQHGIALLGLAMPAAHALGVSKVYIAATYAESDPKNLVCASYPTIDNHVRCAGILAVHEGFERNRQDKANQIVSFARETGMRLSIRACYSSRDGSNCCKCEKCGRTILGILAAGGDPKKMGFCYTGLQFRKLMWKMRYYFPIKYVYYYRDIANAASSRDIELPKSARWLYDRNLDEICQRSYKQHLWSLRLLLVRVYHFLKRR